MLFNQTRSFLLDSRLHHVNMVFLMSWLQTAFLLLRREIGSIPGTRIPGIIVPATLMLTKSDR